jgi:choline kinase
LTADQTQYGNILRLNLTGESPLLHPSNTHKQLVVIDFEYASANTPGLEFANHFTEWCYNYHDLVAPYACNEHKYPTVEEQLRFIKSYVNHRPQFNARASATPKAMPSAGPGSSISDFLLDSRTPSSLNIVRDYAEEEALRERQVEREVKELMKETRLWRVANSAQWVAWGIVQAKVPGLDAEEQAGAGLVPSLEPMNGQEHPITETSFNSEKEERLDGHEHGHNKRPEGHAAEAPPQNADGEDAHAIENAEDDEDEFDYLAYTQERAKFFWGDCVELGLVKEEDLPAKLSNSLKRVPY